MAAREFKEVLKLIKNPVRRLWFEQAMQYGQARNSFFAVKVGSEQYKAWLKYFGARSWTPDCLRQIEQLGERSWTAPCEWPENLPI